MDLTARYLLRKRLHRRRIRGWCVRRVVAVGHAAAVARLVTALRRDTYHGLAVVAACLVDAPEGAGPDGATGRDPRPEHPRPMCPWPAAWAASRRP